MGEEGCGERGKGIEKMSMLGAGRGARERGGRRLEVEVNSKHFCISASVLLGDVSRLTTPAIDQQSSHRSSRERERDRQTDRDRDRQRETERERERERETLRPAGPISAMNRWYLCSPPGSYS